MPRLMIAVAFVLAIATMTASIAMAAGSSGFPTGTRSACAKTTCTPPLTVSKPAPAPKKKR